MYVAFVKLNVFSCLSVFYPYASTSAPTYPLPPPTTLVGALAYSYMRKDHIEDVVEGGKRHSAAEKMLNYIVYATAGSKGYVVTRDVERVYQVIYQRKERWTEEHKDLWYTVAVRGVVKYLDDELYVVYLSKTPEVLSYAYGIVRIGRKESHVIVKSVTIRHLNEVLVKDPHVRIFETAFYTPVNIAECEDETSITTHMNKLVTLSFAYTKEHETEEFYLPKGLGLMKCRLLDKGVLIRLEDLYVAIPRSLLNGT